LIFLISTGTSFELYSLGDTCRGDCGQQAGNALLCLGDDDGQSYCSRPCGDPFPACPSGFTCVALSEQSTAARGSEEPTDYCVKQSREPVPEGSQVTAAAPGA
jgi:hypothetical protein